MCVHTMNSANKCELNPIEFVPIKRTATIFHIYIYIPIFNIQQYYDFSIAKHKDFIVKNDCRYSLNKFCSTFPGMIGSYCALCGSALSTNMLLSFKRLHIRY